MKVIVAILAVALVVSNVVWADAYQRLRMHDMQTEAWLDIANAVVRGGCHNVEGMGK